MPGSSRRRNQREEMIAIDLGTRTTKAVHLRRAGSDYVLVNYVLEDAPEQGKSTSRGAWGDHLRKVLRGLGGGGRRVVLTLGAENATLWQVDLPGGSASDLRRMIKLSPRAYLQQDLPDHLFDCHVGSASDEVEPEVGAPRMRRKSRVLVLSARRSLVEDLIESARHAGLSVEGITAGQVATANSFRKACPDAAGQAVGLVDIGYRSSTISVLHEGELVLTRVVNVGAERLSAALESSGAGEGQETGEEETLLSDAVQVSVQKAIQGLAREIDASTGFYLSQYDRPVSQLYVSGGSARSHFILQTLESELGLPCRSWNPAVGLQLRLPSGNTDEIDYEGPQLTAAIGAALSWMEPDGIRLNLMAEQQEELDWRRRDPVRRASWAGAFVLAGLGAWAGWLGWQIYDGKQEVARIERRMALLQQTASQPLEDARRAGELDQRRVALEQHQNQRFLTAAMLDALQHVVVDNVQFHRLTLDRQLQRIDPPRLTARQRRTAAEEGTTPQASGETREQFVLRIQARGYGGRGDVPAQIQAITQHEYFRERLQAENPVVLRELGSEQLDPADTNRRFTLFTLECRFAERSFRHE